MEFKFYINPDSGKLHIHDHDVDPEDIFDFFSQRTILERKRQDGSFEAFGRIPSGRFLTVVYRKEPPDTIFVITAFDLKDRQIIDKLTRELE